MAEYYRNGGLPPWAVGRGDSVTAPLVQNDYYPYAGGPAKAPHIKDDYSSYPPAPSQPQYVPPQRYSAFTPHGGPQHSYNGY